MPEIGPRFRLRSLALHAVGDLLLQGFQADVVGMGIPIILARALEHSHLINRTTQVGLILPVLRVHHKISICSHCLFGRRVRASVPS